MVNNDELKDILKQLENEENMKLEEDRNIEENTRTNADCLNDIANINLVLSIIGAVWILANSFIDKVNWMGITIGIASLIAGTTLFFLLKTIVDIYWEVEK